MYFGPPAVDLREFPSLPDEAIPPIKMGDGEAPAVPEFKHLGSVTTGAQLELLLNFDCRVTGIRQSAKGAGPGLQGGTD